jgi:arylsulfatase
MDLFDNGIRDDGAEECLEYIRNETFDSDEFLFINLMEAHAPYVPPQEYRTVELGKSPGLFESISGSVDADPETVRQAYEDSVKYLSDIYKKIFEELSDDFDYIITLGDHGEMFGNHSMWTHVHGVYPELTHIPLVISGDGVSGTEETPVSLLDVHRTVLNITGVEAESRGQDLLDDVSQVGRITEYHGLIQDQVYRLSQQDISDDLIDKYDSELRGVLLAGGYYGYETVDGFMEVGKSVDDPQERLSEIIADLSVREVESESTEKLSQETLDQLEDLGYA